MLWIGNKVNTKTKIDQQYLLNQYGFPTYALADSKYYLQILNRTVKGYATCLKGHQLIMMFQAKGFDKKQ